MERRSPFLRQIFCLGLALLVAGPALALERVELRLSKENPALHARLVAASLVFAANRQDRNQPRDILSAALADYTRMVETLYGAGHYSGVVEILIDGREAADIPLLAVPAQMRAVLIKIDPGPQFEFDETGITPLAPNSTVLPAFSKGQIAESGTIREAVSKALGDWRDLGHARARPAGQRILADHGTAKLDVDIRLDPGPEMRFGALNITTPSRVRADRIRRIAGLPSGERFSPATLEKVAARLRRTGAFSSVSLEESTTDGPDNTLDIALSTADEKPRRFGFGAELSSREGVNLSGFWMHRNLFHGAERLRIDGFINQIGGGTSGIDYGLGTRLDIPAMLGPDTTGFVLFDLKHLKEPDFSSDTVALNFGVARIYSAQRSQETAIGLQSAVTDDSLGVRRFALLTFPNTLTLEGRDDPLDPARGYFLHVDAMPFVGLAGSKPGARAFIDARGYRAFGQQQGLVFASRLQIGSVLGVGILDANPDFLFFSGGGGSVRGQPYQSLNVDLGGGVELGGRSFIGLSFEARASVSERIGAVIFADAGYVGANSFFDGSGNWHAGAGIGLRYKTVLGPIRFDVAAPINGSTGNGLQVYLGIGQAF